MQLVPQPEWTLFSHLLIWHGRRRCFARHPDCPACEVKDYCPRIGVERAMRKPQKAIRAKRAAKINPA
jgi:endonuclease III